MCVWRIQSHSVNDQLCVVVQRPRCSAAGRRTARKVKEKKKKCGCAWSTGHAGLHLHPTLWCPSAFLNTLRRTSVNRNSYHSQRKVALIWVGCPGLSNMQMDQTASFSVYTRSKSSRENMTNLKSFSINYFRSYLQTGVKVQCTSVWLHYIHLADACCPQRLTISESRENMNFKT